MFTVDALFFLKITLRFRELWSSGVDWERSSESSSDLSLSEYCCCIIALLYCYCHGYHSLNCYFLGGFFFFMTQKGCFLRFFNAVNSSRKASVNSITKSYSGIPQVAATIHPIRIYWLMLSRQTFSSSKKASWSLQSTSS